MSANKKRSITVDKIRYIYTIKERMDDIKVTIYTENQKNPCYFRYYWNVILRIVIIWNGINF
ncbi:MAG: hypothetical protein K2I03_13330 [Lachnospiraceae bacterium]|nr:hypothetical protein [Lachnospiraceae bacterium]